MTQLIHVAPSAPFLVMNPANPEVLTSIIPGTRGINVRGHQLWAVPHTLDAVRVLRNLGAPAPSPILGRYVWPGRYAPFMAQRETAAFLTLNPRCFVLNDMGTGKTLASLWAFDYLRSVGVRRRMILFAPLSTLDATWASEVMLNFPHLRYAVLHGDRARRFKLLGGDYDVYIVNHDGVGILSEAVSKRNDIDLVVIDELSAFRTHGTERWKAMNRITKRPEVWVWGMGATPTPNAPTDAWAQIKLILPSAVPDYFKRFRDMTMNQVTAFKWTPKPDAMDIVYRVMQPAIRFTRDQCVDLPPTTYQHREVRLSPEQAKAYQEMSTKLRMDYAAGTAKAVNEADKAMKLVQVAAGAVYDSTSGDPIILPNTDRVKVLKEIIAEAPSKVIVFVPFIAALHSLRDELAKDWATDMIYGGTPQAERTEIFHRFQKGSAEMSRVLVANARAMSHGLTLTAAATVVWFAPTVSHETFDQANHRIIRPSQKLNTLIVMLSGTPAERKIYRRLQERQDMQGILLDAVAEATA